MKKILRPDRAIGFAPAGLVLVVIPPAAQLPAASSPASARAAQARTPENPELIGIPASVLLVSREIAAGGLAPHPDDSAAKNAAGIPAATSGGFGVGDNGVHMVESPLSP